MTYETEYNRTSGGTIDRAQIVLEQARSQLDSLEEILREGGPAAESEADRIAEMDTDLQELDSALRREWSDRETLRAHDDGISLTRLCHDVDGDERPAVTLVYEPNSGSLQTVEGVIFSASTNPQKVGIREDGLGGDEYSIFGSGWAAETGRVEKNGRKIGEYVTAEVSD